VVARSVWKAVFVPALTFGNAVLVMGGDVERKLEVIQRDVTRYALGCRFNCGIEFLHGEGDMSSFKFREAQGKLMYSLRLDEMNGERWISRLSAVKRALGIKTKWDRRVEYCARLLGYNKRDWERCDIGESEVRRMIKDKQVEIWRGKMEQKSSLEVNRGGKRHWGGVEGLYDNTRGSGLLADARAGMLDTGVYRSHFEDVDGVCKLCGQGEETVQHVVVACPVLGIRDVSLADALGLGESMNWQALVETKRRLSWWKSEIEELR